MGFVVDVVVEAAGGWSWKIWLREYSARRAWSRACSWSVMRWASGTSSIRRKSRHEDATVGSFGAVAWGSGRDILLMFFLLLTPPFVALVRIVGWVRCVRLASVLRGGFEGLALGLV